MKQRIIPAAAALLVLTFSGALLLNKKAETAVKEASLSIAPEPSEQIDISFIHNGKIAKNSSLYAELLNLELPQPLVAEITSRFSKMFDLRKSQPGDGFTLFMDPDKSVIAFEYVTGDWKRYRLDREGNRFIESINEVGLDRKIRKVEGKVHTTLWDALLPLLPDMNVFFDMVEIFGWEIDFLTEPRVGDSFKIIFELFEKDGRFIKTGRILAVEYTLDDTPYRAFLFTDPAGRQDYFDENGYSLRKTLLKSPLNYRRISSEFSRRRLHPIYKRYRPHLGVDYAAPIGTPIVASGDGYVSFKGTKRGFGNYVEIQHSFGLVTCYGHLQDFAKGIKKGRRVAQGQVIGYVGNTGETTGPHLDYRVRRNGNYLNPLKMTIPAALPVKDEYKEQFRTRVVEYLPRLQEPLSDRLMARLD